MLPLLALLACSTPETPQPAPQPQPPPQAEQPEAPAEDTAPPEPENRPPRVTRFELVPARPLTTDNIRVFLDVEDPDGDVVHQDRRWFVDDEPVMGVSGRYFPADRTEKGQAIRMEVELSDGQHRVTERSNTVLVQNSPPAIHMSPRDVAHLDGLQVRAEDPDGDPLKYSLQGAPPALTIDSGGVLHYHASTDDPGGDYDVTLRVEDDDGGYAEWRFHLHVEPGRAPERRLRGQ